MNQPEFPEKVLPGQPILPIYQTTDKSISNKYIAGENVRLETIIFENSNIPTLVSTVLGRVVINDEISDQNEEEKNNTKIVSVIPIKDSKYKEKQTSSSYKAVTPKVGDFVLARVNKLTHSRINVEIISVLPESTAKNFENNLQLLNLLPTESGEFFKALIRSQDIRSTERDSVKTWECFQPGDIIRASVISLGDGANFYLTTAGNDLGVVFARNENGELLYPLDWETMIVPGTGEIEKRKCAKPF